MQGPQDVNFLRPSWTERPMERSAHKYLFKATARTWACVCTDMFRVAINALKPSPPAHAHGPEAAQKASQVAFKRVYHATPTYGR